MIGFQINYYIAITDQVMVNKMLINYEKLLYSYLKRFRKK